MALYASVMICDAGWIKSSEVIKIITTIKVIKIRRIGPAAEKARRPERVQPVTQLSKVKPTIAEHGWAVIFQF